jgi:hypothetical protein
MKSNTQDNIGITVMTKSRSHLAFGAFTVFSVSLLNARQRTQGPTIKECADRFNGCMSYCEIRAT